MIKFIKQEEVDSTFLITSEYKGTQFQIRSDTKIEEESILDFIKSHSKTEGFINHIDEPTKPPTKEERSRQKRSQMKTEKWRLEVILEEDGLLDDVNNLVSKADKRTQKAWEKAPEITRISNALKGIREGLNLTGEQVDDIFNRANQIQI